MVNWIGGSGDWSTVANWRDEHRRPRATTAVRPIGTYGIIGRANKSNQNRGNGFAVYAPGGTVTGNLFADAHAVFKSNFPGNTYVTTPRDANGAPTGEAFSITADGWVDGVVGRLRK